MSSKTRRRGVSTDPKRPYAERGGALMTPAEAGDYLGVGERMMRRLILDREIPKIKVGKLVRIRVTDLDEYIERRRVPGES